MSVIYVLIPLAIILTIVGIYLFFWAVKSEQFTDLEKEGMSILYETDKNSEDKENNPTQGSEKAANTPNKASKENNSL